MSKQKKGKGMKSKGKTERVSVLSLSLEIERNCETLKTDVKYNDKTEIWDGHIFVFADAKQTADNVEMVPVQVKGTTVGNITKNTIMHSVRKIDLQNYEKNGGAVYFVVLVKDKQSKFFCRLFLPQDIKPILERFDATNKTQSFEFKEIEVKDIPSKLNLFLSNRTLSLVHNFGDIFEQTNGLRISTLSKEIEPGKYPTPQQIIRAFTSDDTYISAVAKGLPNVLIPLARPQGVTLKAYREVGDFVEIDEKKHSVFVGEVSDKDGIKYLIGANLDPKERSIVLKPNFDEMALSEVNITIQGTLNQQLTDIEFAIAFFKERVAEHFQERYAWLKNLRKTFDRIGIKGDVNFSKFTDKDYNKINFLYAALTKGINIKIDTNLHVYEFADYKCLFFAVELKEKLIIFYNPFSNMELIRISDHVDKDSQSANALPATVFFMPSKYLYYKYSNTDYDAIYAALTEIEPTNPILRHALNVQCCMIHAFDDGQAGNEVLEFALKFGQWLQDSTDIDKDCLSINKIQIKKRLGKIELSDGIELGKYTSNSSADIRLAAYILLSEKENAIKEMTALSDERRKEFEGFPLYFLYKVL